ncbi:restriction endonuclease subunit S [Aquimarina macrocephali]|uniref:restriction endonuclease subunit S n=1 Tax=Aquimarina macrocephali TaxID=666563 RepID=UPI0004B00ADB|nr:restriction endonuclease subunit S [Aquimarina macrocephali]
MKNWKKVKLGTLLTESKVVSENPNTDKRIRVKLNVLGVEKRPITKDKKGATKYYIRKAGQFVYGKQNLHKGAFGIIPDELDGFESSLDIPAFDIDETCYPEWIFYFFKKGNFYLKLESLAKGVGSKRIHPKQIFELYIFLPSKDEQKKVLDEIEKAEINNQELVNEIDSQEENLGKLRQSILQDAVEGKLTKEWRVQNSNLKPASELLKIIKEEKAQLVKEKKIKKEKPLSPIRKEQTPFEIPANWEWSRLGEVIYLKSGQDLRPDEYSDSKDFGLPYITGASNLQNEEVIINRWTNKPRSIAYRGNLLFTCKGSGVGKMGWLNVDSAHIARQIMAISTIASPLSYVKVLMDINAKKYNDNATGLIPGVDRGTVRETLIPIPPIEEQKIIVEKTKDFLSNCDLLEEEVLASKINSEKLMQSVLSELLGEENNVLLNKPAPKRGTKKALREIQYNSKTLLMDLVKLLKENGKLHAEDLWKMSQFPDDIDAFYSELKKQIEEEKSIKEVVNEKGYLELV